MILELDQVTAMVGAQTHLYPTSLRLAPGAINVLLGPTQARADELASLSGFVCMIANFVKSGYLLAGGVIVIVIGAIAIAQSESTIVKFVSTIGIGIGIAAACIPLLQKFGISATYCTFV